MDNKKYNGYTNYATWRVNLEILDGLDWDDYEEDITADAIQEMVKEIVFGDSVLAVSYVGAFLEDVNYQEIADNINHDRSYG